MEPQSRSKRPTDKLQSIALQDKAVQPGARQQNLGPVAVAGSPALVEKIVIQYGDRVVKGTTVAQSPVSVEELLQSNQSEIASLQLQVLGTGIVEDFSIEDAKAIFFVKTFDGNSGHDPLHFHNYTPVIQGLWVRIQFQDEEVMEGIVHNTKTYVLEQGFFLIPTDPGNNNKLVYIIKKKLKNFEVLGMRNPPKGYSSFKISKQE